MVAYIMSYEVKAAGMSDIGLIRENNEDVWNALPNQRFYILADGMGGHSAGEVAAREAVNALSTFVAKHININAPAYKLDEARSLILNAIKEVNAHVYKLGRRDNELKGMGTTLCCLHFHPKGLVYAHVGDSRIYRLRKRKLFQMTKDHSLLRELVDLGQISERQAGGFLYKNIITKAIGTEPTVEPSVRFADILDRDLYLMCSDGLSDLLSQGEIEAILNEDLPLEQTAQRLVDSAKEKGGYDNVTVVLTEVQELHEPKDISR
jgi:serine/threonine protein phosphatase PrpC